MAHPIEFGLPSGTAHDLWRWLMLATGLALMARGLFSKEVRIRDSSTWDGLWRGKVATKRWQILYMRFLLVLIGILFLSLALTFRIPGR